VFFHDYYETRVLDVFSTEEAAKEYIENCCGGDPNAEIVEYEVRE
jgi:hypothetical protein